MAASAIEVTIFNARQFSGFVDYKGSENPAYTGRFSTKTELEQELAAPQPKPLNSEAIDEFYRGKLIPLAEELHSEKGRSAILERFEINVRTPDDYRLVFCESPAGNVCFKAKETSEGLLLTESIPIRTTIGDNGILDIQTASLLDSNKGFKPLPTPKLITSLDLDKASEHTIFASEKDRVKQTELTQQGEHKLLRDIKMISLVDEAGEAKSQGTNANLPNAKQPGKDLSPPR